MTILTIQKYVEAPLLTPAVPNAPGTHAVYVKSTYSNDSKDNTVQVEVIDIKSNKVVKEITDEAANGPVWISDTEFAYLSVQKSGNTNVFISGIEESSEPYVAGSLSGTAGNAKCQILDDGRVAFVFGGLANKDGSLHNPNDEPPKSNGARYYTTLPPRHMHSWVSPRIRTLFYLLLQKNKDRKFTVSTVHNAFATNSEKIERHLNYEDGNGDFSVSKDAIVYVAMSLKNNPCTSTRLETYHVRIPDFSQPPDATSWLPIEGLTGTATSPAISPDGKKLVVLRMGKDGAEAGMFHIILFSDFASSKKHVRLLEPENDKFVQDLNPESIEWRDNDTLVTPTYEAGHSTFLTFSAHADANDAPAKFPVLGLINGFSPLGKDKLLVSGTTLVDSGYLQVLDLSKSSKDDAHATQLFSTSDSGKAHGFDNTHYEDLHISSSNKSHKIHSLIMKPYDFSPDKTYPVAFLIHGGPQIATFNTWNNYNIHPQLFAAQGYIAVCPNYIGSRGYGQAFTDAINSDWTGQPYQDVVDVFEYLRDHVKYADTSRAILGGISYGGYFTNWVAGQPLAREMKALFTYSGIFSSHYMIATDETFCTTEDFGGNPWDSQKVWEIWDRGDPARHVAKWKTPHLIVHGDMDFRCSIDSAIAAYNALQIQKVDSALLIFEGESHLISKPENVVVMFDTTFEFLNPKVGLKAGGKDRAIPIR